MRVSIRLNLRFEIVLVMLAIVVGLASNGLAKINAVVASEERNLAQRSAAAAKEIKCLIGDSVDKAATGSKLVDEAGVTMADIVDSVRRVRTS